MKKDGRTLSGSIQRDVSLAICQCLVGSANRSEEGVLRD